MPPNVQLLLAEDDEGHYRLLTKNLQRLDIQHPLLRFTDGQALLDWLNEDTARRASQPAILLLDLNLPRISGLEVLRYVKASPWWQTLPVIVLTTATNPEDIDACYDLGCTAYISKPRKSSQFQELIDLIQRSARLALSQDHERAFPARIFDSW